MNVVQVYSFWPWGTSSQTGFRRSNSRGLLSDYDIEGGRVEVQCYLYGHCWSGSTLVVLSRPWNPHPACIRASRLLFDTLSPGPPIIYAAYAPSLSLYGTEYWAGLID